MVHGQVAVDMEVLRFTIARFDDHNDLQVLGQRHLAYA